MDQFERARLIDVCAGQVIACIVVGGIAAFGGSAIGAAIGVGVAALVRFVWHSRKL